MILPYNLVTKGWMVCDGRLLSVDENLALFSLLGNNFGGNGTINFALPDLRERAVVQTGQSSGTSVYELGQMGGSESRTLNSSQLPNHNHALLASSAAGIGSSPEGNELANAGLGNNIYSDAQNIITMKVGSIGAAGGSHPFNIQQPYLALEYCIAIEGVYPTRD